jgi:hypothetical protein
MKPFIEFGARIGAVIQNVCANVDFDVVSLPGGSLIAILVWLCALRGRSVLRRSSAESPLAIRRAPQHQHHPLAIDRSADAGIEAVITHADPIKEKLAAFSTQLK